MVSAIKVAMFEQILSFELELKRNLYQRTRNIDYLGVYEFFKKRSGALIILSSIYLFYVPVC